jgi:hypothetical protein
MHVSVWVMTVIITNEDITVWLFAGHREDMVRSRLSLSLTLHGMNTKDNTMDCQAGLGFDSFGNHSLLVTITMYISTQAMTRIIPNKDSTVWF